MGFAQRRGLNLPYAGAILIAILFATGCSSTSPLPAAPDSIPAAAATKYDNMIVKRPGSSPEDGKAYLVRSGKKHWVVNAAWFSSNGYRFPEDVREIPAAELDAIPSGEPIQ